MTSAFEDNIDRTLRLSTAHIPQSLDSKLNGDASVINTPFGWRLCVGIMSNKKCPEELLRLIRLAEKLGCKFLEFDRDTEVHDCLPTYEWE